MTAKVLNKHVNICTTLSDGDSGTTSKSDKEHNHDSSYVASSHTHTISEVEDLQDTLNSKAENEHIHKMSDITDLSINLSGVAASSHTHTISEITNLQTTLDSKSDTGHNHDSSYAIFSHTHSIANITNLQTSLDAKAASSNTHTDYLTNSEIMDLVYPVGSVYIGLRLLEPSILFGFGACEYVFYSTLYESNELSSSPSSITVYVYKRTA